MRRASWVVVPVLSFAFLAGCASSGDHAAPTPAPEPVARSSAWTGITEAVALVHSTKNNKAHGTVKFTETANGVSIVADMEGLKPNSKHAFHVHEFGDMTSGDGKSAGGHYNPENHPHAGPDAPMHHAGDLGNVETDAKGHAHYERVIQGISIAGDTNPILGRCVVFHAAEDDLSSQPAGNAGDRIAWGVIGVAKPAGK